MMPFVRTFESNLFALIAVALFGRLGWLIFQTGAHLSTAGCAYYGHLLCGIGHSYAPGGLAVLLALIVSGAGLFAAWEMFAGRRRGMLILLALYGLQIPIFATSAKVYHIPTSFNLYLLAQVKQHALGINFLALVLAFSAIGLWQNARRR